MALKPKKTSGKVGASDAVKQALKRKYGEGNVITGKGGGFHVKGQGRVSLAQARRTTGIAAPKRKLRGRVPAYGDWGFVAALNRAMTPRKKKA